MVYKFDPKYVDGTIFCLEDWNMAGDFMEYWRANKPIPASYFPKSLQVDDANQVLPDLFHTSSPSYSRYIRDSLAGVAERIDYV